MRHWYSALEVPREAFVSEPLFHLWTLVLAPLHWCRPAQRIPGAGASASADEERI